MTSLLNIAYKNQSDKQKLLRFYGGKRAYLEIKTNLL